MLLPPIFGCSKRNVAIINVVSSCSSLRERGIFYTQLKDSINKGRFGFLQIDATNAAFCWVRWTTGKCGFFVSFANRFGCQTGAFVQVLGTFDQKNGAYNLFSSFIEASWLMCQGSIPFANFLTSRAAFC